MAIIGKKLILLKQTNHLFQILTSKMKLKVIFTAAKLCLIRVIFLWNSVRKKMLNFILIKFFEYFQRKKTKPGSEEEISKMLKRKKNLN